MKITREYYFHFWLINSFTIALVSLAAPVIPPFAIFAWGINGVGPAIMSVVVFTLLQIPLLLLIHISPYSSTEYGFLMWEISKCSFKQIKKTTNPITYLFFKFDRLSPFGLIRNDVYKRAINLYETNLDPSLLFCLNVNFAESLLKEGDFGAAVGHLKTALIIKPKDLIANYLLAQCLERIGEIKKALVSYEMALEIAESLTKDLPTYIKNQIARIENEGPAPKGAAPGLKFVMY